MQNFFLNSLGKLFKILTFTKKSDLISMNETYLLEKFEEYEKSTSGWDELYHVSLNVNKINMRLIVENKC